MHRRVATSSRDDASWMAGGVRGFQVDVAEDEVLLHDEAVKPIDIGLEDEGPLDPVHGEERETAGPRVMDSNGLDRRHRVAAREWVSGPSTSMSSTSPRPNRVTWANG